MKGVLFIVFWSVCISAQAQDTTFNVTILPKAEDIKQSVGEKIYGAKKKKAKAKGEKKNTVFAEAGLFWGTLYNGKLDYTNPTLGISSEYGSSNSKSVGYLRKIFVTPRRVRVAVGIAVGQTTFDFAQNINLRVQNDSVFGISNDTLSYIKNRLRSTQLQIPILLQFRLAGKMPGKKTLGDKDPLYSPVKLSFGIVPSIMIGGSMKQKYRYQEVLYTQVQKTKGILNPLQCYATARVSVFGSAGLFVNYDLNRFFQPHLYPKLNAVSVGIVLGGGL